MTFFRKALAAIVLTAAPAAAHAAPILNDENGHYYELVSGRFSWTQALAGAASRTYEVQTGYLVTVTSFEENDFVQGLFSGFAWIAASDAGSEGNFTWRAGPENGTSLSFSNWESAEPNNGNSPDAGTEDYTLMVSDTGMWNDVRDNFGLSYIVEYNAPSVAAVPEPATWATMLLGFGLIGGATRYRRRKIALA